MLHEQFEHVHDGDLVPRDPMAGAGGVVKHQRQGDRAYVLETGRTTLSGTGKELMESDAVRKAYLGG